MAAILCATETLDGEKLKLGYSYEPTNLHSQKAVTEYWNRWVTAVNTALEPKGYSSGLKKQGVGSQQDSELVSKYKDLAGIYDYSATIIYLVPRDNKFQRVIYVDREEPEVKGLTVSKKWLDNNNAYNTRISEIKVQLYTVKDGVETPVEGKILILNENNKWKDTFVDLPKTDEAGNEIIYTVKEIDSPPGYISTGTVRTSGKFGSTSSAYRITNKLLTEVKVTKTWDDSDDLDGLRPSAINVELYANDNPTGKKVTLDAKNNWTFTFEGLYRCDDNGNNITYTVKEDAIEGYEPTYTSSEDSSNGYTTITIKNTHIPKYAGYVEITGKVWEDRPDGKANKINSLLDDDELGLGGIKVTLKDKDGNQFDATSTTTTAEDGTYTIKVNYNPNQDVYKLHADDSIPKKKTEKQTTETKLKTAYIEFEYDGYIYTTVSNGGYKEVNKSKAWEIKTSRNALDKKYSTITSTSPKFTEMPEEDKKVIASTKDIIKNFIKYRDQTVNKNKVNTETRTESQTVKYCNGDGTYIRTNPNGAWNEVIKGEHTCENCTGTGHSVRTFDGIEVIKIKNVNLGLFRRELPDLSIKEDISLVEVVENGKKLKYKYDAVVTDEASEDVKVQFANKQTYTYRRPVNPTLIEEFKETYDPTKPKSEILQVYVTYAVKITNESQTLRAKINSIVNCFDNRYELVSVKKSTTAINNKNIIKYSDQEKESIYRQPEEDYTEIKINNLNLSINAGQTSTTIYLRYKVSIDAVMELLNKDATLSNSVEIDSYTTYYTSGTRYAQYGKNGRNGTVYAGYDKDSHPGNAGIQSQNVDYKYTFTDDAGNKKTVTYKDVEVLKSTENLVEYELPDGTKVKMPQDDTDIAPSFLLDGPEEPIESEEPVQPEDPVQPEEPEEISKTIIIGGIVFEDTDEIDEDNQRLGNGKYDEDTERTSENVKVELYELEKDESGKITGIKLAQHYNNETNLVDAIVYTDANGDYTFELDKQENKEYFIKYTYGDDTSEFEDENTFTTMDGGKTKVNARNYKSTIISDQNPVKTILAKKYTDESFDKMWYVKENLDGYSIAVDNMLDRLEIEDLQYNNFHEEKAEDGTISKYVKPENMTAYSKPFLIPKDIDLDSIGTFDFGIIERPREDLVVEKTITNFKITLANGQVLTEGDPRTQNLAYVKAMGFDPKGNSKRLLVEIDTELIQGAYLKADYEITVTNNNEIDYDYGEKTDYYSGNEDAWEELTDYEKYEHYIATSEKANYYYYGNSDGLSEMKSTITLVDYMNAEATVNGEEWETKNITDIESYISPDTKTVLQNNQYKIINITGNSEMKKSIARNDSFIVSMTISKTLANNDKNAFDNNVEILTIDGKTARTVNTSEEGENNYKDYMPGNLIPTVSKGVEQDDDIVDIIITPPTGIVTYIIYTIVGVLGLVTIVFGITFIKKKILIK